VFVTSLGVTQAGLELASRTLGEPWRVVGIGYQPSGGHGAGWVGRLVAGGAAHLGVAVPDGEPIANDDRTAGPDYGVGNDESRGAPRRTASSSVPARGVRPG